MGVKQFKVKSSDLVLGMFVSGLDRPWTQTPFPLQGFFIREMDEVFQLKRYCNHVYIDIQKGKGPLQRDLPLPPRVKRQAPIRMPANQPVDVKVGPIKIKHNVYAHFNPLQKEIPAAQQLHLQISRSIGEIDSVLNDSVGTSVAVTKRLAGEMVDSVLRNPDALSWLTRVKEKDEHSYSHSVRSAIWAILFGRYIGLPKKDLDVLAFGVLLKDVGKIHLGDSLLDSEELSDEERAEYESFVVRGVESLKACRAVGPKIISVVQTHCERLNGSGFPLHLKGDKIPLLGKIAGLVTFYDDVTNPRNGDKAISPSRAVARLYEMRDIAFQEELVVEFIRAIGLYPTGSLVELSSGEVGVVVEQNFSRRLKPKIMLVLDSNKKMLAKPKLKDLANKEQKIQSQIDKGKKRLEDVSRLDIVSDLEPGSFDVDIATVRDAYLFSEQKQGVWQSLSKGLRSMNIFS